MIPPVYFFEVFALVNAILAHLVVGHPGKVFGTLPAEASFLLRMFGVQLAAGVIGRLIFAAIGGKAREYLAVIRSREWLIDTVRLIVFAVLIVHAYMLLKIALPLVHPRLFDQELWNLDAALLGGHSPNVLLLSMFSNPTFLRAIDVSYAVLFALSVHFAFAFFLSAPDRLIRVGFANANSVLWMIGAWLYLAIPSLGPAYRFPEVWAPYAAYLQNTLAMQRSLMENYRIVAGYARGTINILLGVAAFPSLHVAFETLVWLCMRRVWRWGALVFGVVFFIIFLGSVITGWHYLIDSLAGVLIAIPCYAFFFARPQYRRPEIRFDEHATD